MRETFKTVYLLKNNWKYFKELGRNGSEKTRTSLERRSTSSAMTKMRRAQWRRPEVGGRLRKKKMWTPRNRMKTTTTSDGSKVARHREQVIAEMRAWLKPLRNDSMADATVRRDVERTPWYVLPCLNWWRVWPQNLCRPIFNVTDLDLFSFLYLAWIFIFAENCRFRRKFSNFATEK